ncbi:Serine/threonine-protein kinase PknD [compost metagenome]
MTPRSRNGVAFAMIFSALMGCNAPTAETGALHELQDKIVAAPRRASGLFLSLKQAPYSVQFVRQLDWDQAEATLTNTDGTIPVQNQTITASLDATNGRRAMLSFTPVKPAGNYTLAINLKRKDSAGTMQTIATGQNAGFTINPGANAITVSLTANSTGELLVDVSKPVLVLNTLTSDVNTKSHFDAVRVAGDGTGGNLLGTSPTTAAFREIAGIEADAAGALYVADSGNHQIRKIPASGATQILAGKSDGTSGFAGDGALATAASLNTPRGLTRDPATGNIFFCDMANNRIRCISNGDNKIYTVAGGGSNTGDTVAYAVTAQLNQPFGLAADAAGNVYASERGTGRVLRIATNGTMTTLATFNTGTIGPVAIDRTNGLLWVANGPEVRVISGIAGATPTLLPTPVFTATGAGAYLTGLAFDQLGTLFAAQTSDTGTPGATNTKIWRVAVDTLGGALAGRAAEAIAGTGATGAGATAYSVPTIAVANANNQLLAGRNWCSLFVDMSAGLSGTTLSGVLYAGNSYPGAHAQVVRFTPSSL